MRAVFTAAVLLALACGTTIRSQDKPSWEPVRGSGFEGIPVTLIPVGDPKKDKLPDAKAIWSGLVEGMAKDADTQKLLKTLLNCKAVEVAVLPKKVDGKFRPAPPSGKSQVYIGIRFSEGEVGKDEFKGCILGSATHTGFEVPDTRKWDEKATVWDAFLIASNEYLHRNKKGYHLHHGLLVPGFNGPFDGIDDDALAPNKRGGYIKKASEEFLAKYKK